LNLRNRTTGYRIKKGVAVALMTTLLFFVLDGDIHPNKPSHNAYAQTSTATCQKLPIATVTASRNSISARNVLDNNLNTAWTGRGMGVWIQADLGSNMNICDVNIAWYLGNMRNYNFIISVSADGSTFTNVFSGKSSGTTLSFEKYTVAGGTTGRYVRITVYGNNFNNYAGITELSIDGSSSVAPLQPIANNENIQTNSGAPVQITLTGTDPIAGDVLTFTVVSQPQHGTLTPGTVSSIVYYTPNTGFSGTDSFTYKATNGQGVYSNIATVTITVNQLQSPGNQLQMYDNFEGGTYVLSANVDTQTSPNGKWVDLYNGLGSAGVEAANSTNNVFFESPQVSTSADQTHSTLVYSTQQWGNSQLDIDVKTVQQTRQNSPPNPWEAAWVLFRYTDEYHYYWFVIKSNGIEFGKKDCTTCTDTTQGQQFLVTATNPTLQIGKWQHWTVTAIGNHITIFVNGNKLADYVDTTMSQQLSSGAVAMYSEDANTNFDNVYETPQ